MIWKVILFNLAEVDGMEGEEGSDPSGRYGGNDRAYLPPPQLGMELSECRRGASGALRYGRLLQMGEISERLARTVVATEQLREADSEMAMP